MQQCTDERREAILFHVSELPPGSTNSAYPMSYYMTLMFISRYDSSAANVALDRVLCHGKCVRVSITGRLAVLYPVLPSPGTATPTPIAQNHSHLHSGFPGPHTEAGKSSHAMSSQPLKFAHPCLNDSPWLLTVPRVGESPRWLN